MGAAVAAAADGRKVTTKRFRDAAGKERRADLGRVRTNELANIAVKQEQMIADFRVLRLDWALPHDD